MNITKEKETAHNLVLKFLKPTQDMATAIKCSLICCDVMISEIENMDELHDIGYLRFWNEVKAEIKNL